MTMVTTIPFNAEQGDWKPQEVLYLAKSAAPVEALVDAM